MYTYTLLVLFLGLACSATTILVLCERGENELTAMFALSYLRAPLAAPPAWSCACAPPLLRPRQQLRTVAGQVHAQSKVQRTLHLTVEPGAWTGPWATAAWPLKHRHTPERERARQIRNFERKGRNAPKQKLPNATHQTSRCARAVFAASRTCPPSCACAAHTDTASKAPVSRESSHAEASHRRTSSSCRFWSIAWKRSS